MYFDNKNFISFKGVLYMPNFWQNFIPISQLFRSSYTVNFHTDVTIVRMVLFEKAQNIIICIIYMTTHVKYLA